MAFFINLALESLHLGMAVHPFEFVDMLSPDSYHILEEGRLHDRPAYCQKGAG